MLHPEQVHIFKLWHVYLDNVNPLLKVTHTPSLQALIINAASDVTKISPALGALMFSIYSVSILSLAPEECETSFGSSKDDLLRTYQFGCQQALLDCQFLRSGDRDCLTAFFLYLVSLQDQLGPANFIGIYQAWHRSKVPILSTCRCNTNCQTSGYSQRVNLFQAFST